MKKQNDNSNRTKGKTKEKLRKNAEQREKDSTYIKLDIAEKKELLFDPEKILDPEPKEFENGTSTMYSYVVEDPKFPGIEKIFSTSSRQLSEPIEELLSEGHRLFMLEKEKFGNTERYHIYPRD